MSVVKPHIILEAIHDWGVITKEHNNWPALTSPGGWDPKGVLHHHTGIARNGLSLPDYVQANVRVLSQGRPDLDPPLCHFAPAPDGVLHCIGWANCNHAGPGDPRVIEKIIKETYKGKRGTLVSHDGNPDLYGLEYMSPGTSFGKHQWPDEMIECGARTAAAICQAHGWGGGSNLEHGEFTTRKADRNIGVSGNENVRPRVALLLAKGPHPKPPPPPPAPQPPVPIPDPYPDVTSGGDEMFDPYFVQVKGDVRLYVVTLGGTRHVKNHTEHVALTKGGVKATVEIITESELADLLEIE